MIKSKKWVFFALFICLDLFIALPLASAQSNNRPDALAYFKRGLEYLINGDYDKAIADYSYVIRLDPENAVTYAMRARAYYEKEDYDRAIADCTLAIKYDRNNTSAYAIRGSSYGKKGDLDKAIKDWEAVLRVNPKLENAKQNIEKAKQQRGY
jgi:tetratricopeptide (TPR) repeat protein